MKLLKTTAVVLLLIQTFHLASLQDSTDSPGRTIDKSWWRDRPKNEIPKQVADSDQGNDGDYSGIASGSMVMNSEEERNIAGEANETESDVTTASPHVFHNGMKKKHKHQKTTVSLTMTAANATNSNHSVEAKEANLTATSQNSTGSPEVPSTTTQNSTTELANGTGSANATSAPTPAAPDVNEMMTNSSTGEFPPKTSDQNSTAALNATGNGPTNANPNVLEDTTTTNPNVPEDPMTTNPSLPEDTTNINPNVSEDATSAANPNMPENASSAAPVPPEKSNNTDKSAGGSGSSSERGVASDPNKSTRKGAWGAVLGTAVAVALVGLVAYLILKKRHQKAFSHRKLVEDFPADPAHLPLRRSVEIPPEYHVSSRPFWRAQRGQEAPVGSKYLAGSVAPQSTD
ncbi:mucin-15 isoform X1 [Amphiprion ocellaris]|uniref:mucin-15 isoform X1 n=1 Tax=Amphiprion ocellaris TaxID=80972 RepID=UPI00241185A0|nr:mucin-15 isoform X1 [Amphiprion ocellaris]